jgi:hypothetical protein
LHQIKDIMNNSGGNKRGGSRPNSSRPSSNKPTRGGTERSGAKPAIKLLKNQILRQKDLKTQMKFVLTNTYQIQVFVHVVMPIFTFSRGMLK